MLIKIACERTEKGSKWTYQIDIVKINYIVVLIQLIINVIRLIEYFLLS